MNNKFLNFLAYIALVIAAILMITSTVIPLVGINIEGPLLSIFDFVKEILVLVVIGIAAYAFTVGKKKWIKVVFWISVLVFVAVTIIKYV